MTFPELIPPLPETEKTTVEWHGQFYDYLFTNLGSNSWSVQRKGSPNYLGHLIRDNKFFDFSFKDTEVPQSGRTTGATLGQVFSEFL